MEDVSEREFISCRIAILTLSDTRTLQDDKSGELLKKRILAAGHTLADRKILQDDRDLIANQLRVWVLDPDVDIIISTGGTGLTGRDVTIEAHRDVYEKEIDKYYLERLNENYNNWINDQAFKIIRISTKDINYNSIDNLKKSFAQLLKISI